MLKKSKMLTKRWQNVDRNLKAFFWTLKGKWNEKAFLRDHPKEKRRETKSLLLKSSIEVKCSILQVLNSEGNVTKLIAMTFLPAEFFLCVSSDDDHSVIWTIHYLGEAMVIRLEIWICTSPGIFRIKAKGGEKEHEYSPWESMYMLFYQYWAVVITLPFVFLLWHRFL